MIDGVCSHCRQAGQVARYRLADVGLRWLDAGCAERLGAMGMHLIAVADTNPRVEDLGADARDRVGIGQRRSAVPA